MAKYKYKSNCQSKSLFCPFASDTNNCNSKTEALKYMRSLEKELVSIIELETNCDSNYYIFGDKKIIGEVRNYDDAKAFVRGLMFFDYYYQLDVMSYNGLYFHVLKDDYINK